MTAHSFVPRNRRRALTRGAAYVEVLVIVGVVLLLGVAAVTMLGNASSEQAGKEAACVSSFNCGPGGKAGPAGDGDLASKFGTAGAPGTVGTPGTTGESKSLLTSAGDVAKGFFVDGLWGTVTGVVSAVAHPIDTVEGIGYAVAHPITTATAIKDGVVTAWNDNPQRLVGAGIFQVVTLPFAATKGAKVAEIATEVEDVAKIAKATEEAAAVAKATKEAEEAAQAAAAVKAAEAEAAEASRVAKADCVGGVCTNGSCFGPGTPVATPDGERAIETIAPGDLVMARDPETGTTEARRVERLFITHQREVLDIGFERDDGTVENLVVTPEHPFWHEDEGFVPIAALSPGDLVRSAEGHLRIRSMAALPARITVYNFEVESAHTYFVGKSAAWVHNSCGKPVLGDEVLVPRSDGSISGGKIIGESADGKVLVEVPAANGQTGTKLVSRDSLVKRRDIGEQVSVPRSDGSTSIGTIERRLPDGRVVVTWNEKGQVAEKTLKESALGDAPGAKTPTAPPVKFGDPYVSAKDGYFPDRLFSDYMPPGKTIPDEGWKIHVSADPARSYDVANRVLPELRDMGVAHKVMTDPAAYAKMTGGQTGKFITIYPNNAEEAAAIAKMIDGKLGDLKGTAPVIAGERPLGSSGSVYTRYGGFTKSTVTDPVTGREVGDIRGQTAPPWIKDPFHP